MELRKRKLLKKHKVAVKRLKDILDKGFYLAGGTAIYYYIKHRHSVDLDFFINDKIDLREFQVFFNQNEIKLISKDTLHVIVEGINVSFFQYLYPLLKPLNNLDILKVASLEDILCMKIAAIIQRGSRKDFIDAYFVMKKLNLRGEDVISLFIQKYGKYDELVIRKGLSYFEDAESEPEFPMIKKVKWDEVKNFFIKEFAKI